MRSTFLLVVVAIISLVTAFVAVGFLWAQAGLHLSMHGWIAYGLGCAASVGLASGLFYLTFKSSRDGYDDIQRPDTHEE